MNITEALAQRSAALRHEDLSAEVRHWAGVSVMDTFGVMLAGAAEPPVRIVAHVTGGSPGPAFVLAGAGRAAPADAAFINGVAAHVLDFDASNATFSGHPAAHLLPALLSLVELSQASGADFLTAYVAGFETQSRIARGMDTAHFERGWFSTSTQGVFGAAAGASHLLRLDVQQTAQALSVAAMLASGSVAHAGTMTKPLGSGHAARNGVMAALLVQQGLTAAPDGIGDRRGFLNLFVGPGHYDTDAMLRGWGAPFDILETATGLKRHPCCGQFHAALDAVGGLVRDNTIAPDDVDHLEVRIVTTRFAHTDRSDPKSGTDAKFSVLYCLARTLMHGRPRLMDFDGDAHLDPQARALMARIDCAPEPDTPPDLPLRAQGAVRVALILRDGRRLEVQRAKPVGRTAAEPPTVMMIEDKFQDCLKRSAYADHGAQLLVALRDISALPKAARLTQILAGQDV